MRVWTNNEDDARTKFQDATQKIYDEITSFNFDDNIAKYNEILTRIVRTEGEYLDPSYTWDAAAEDEKNSDYEAQDASVLIDAFKALKNEDVSLRNLLNVFYSVPALSDVKSPYGLDIDIQVLLLVARRLSNTSAIEDDNRKEIVEIFNDIPETDVEFMEKLKNSKSVNEIDSIFDIEGVKEAVARVCSVFMNKNNVIVEFVEEAMSKKPEIDSNKITDETKDAYNSVETLVEWAIDYPEYSLVGAAFEAISALLKKLMKYVTDLEDITENGYAKYLRSYLYVNHIELTVPECLAKW
jgi:hypothetical protein